MKPVTAMDTAMKHLKNVNVDFPTADRPTILMRFDYTVSYEGENIEIEVEAEFEDEETHYITKLIHPKGWNIDSTELDDATVEAITMESFATAKAYEIF